MWATLRAWFKPPRRLRLQRGGVVIIISVFGLGFATLNTGNNLLYLLVGALLGMIALSGWLSEQVISGLRIERRVPHAVTAGQPARIEYRVENRKRRLPSVSLELRDVDVRRELRLVQPELEPAYLPLVAARQAAHASARLTFARRGVYRFERMVLATGYPFGLFIKERDVHVPGTIVVWPRTDRPVRAVRGGLGRGVRREAGTGAALGAERGDYRGLRPYRAGDDPRDVHWRTSARRAEPMVREYDRDAADTYWLVLDPGAPDEASGEAAIETAAALAAAAAARGDRFGFAAGEARVQPYAGAGQLEAVLDVLARVDLGRTQLALPAAAGECVLVSARGDAAGGFADIVAVQP